MLARCSAVLLVVALAAARTAHADKLDQDSKKWLEDVGAIILPDEAKTYTQLKDRGERVEFEKIFWARRDPDLRTPDNESQQQFLGRKAEADKRFSTAGFIGSATGCGRLFILLGEPDSVKDEDIGAVLGAPASVEGLVKSGVERSSANEATKLPARSPQLWTYKDRRDVSFSGGQATISVDLRCGVRPAVSANLDRIAAEHIVNPGLSYKVTAGRITRLADLMPKPTPGQEMLKSDRQDFTVAAQIGYYRAEGPTAVIGLVRADAAGLSLQEAAGTKTATVTVAAHAVTDDGRVAAVDERRVIAPVGDGGAVLVTYRLFLRPGHYTLHYGVLDGKTGKGAVGTIPAEVPDLNGAGLSAGSLLVVKDVVEAASSDPADPLDGFVLGGLRLVPRFGNAFARAEAAHFFYNVNGSVDEVTGKSDLTIGLSLLKGTKLVASAPNQSFTDQHVVTSVGPVDLQFEPGTYTARLRVKDNLTQKQATVDQAFEVK